MDCKRRIDQADEMMHAGQPAEASKIFEEVLAANTPLENAADIHSKLGVAYIQTRRLNDAITMFSKAVELDSSLVKAYQNLCLAYIHKREIEKAIECGEKGLEIAPDSPDLLKAVANAKRANADVKGALSLIEKAITLQKDNPALLLIYGSLLYETGKKQESCDVFTKILSLRPDFPTAHRMLSRVYRYQKDDPHLQQLHALLDVESRPAHETAELEFTLAKAYEDIEDFEKSFEHYKRGNALMRNTSLYDAGVTNAFFETIKQTFSADVMKEALICVDNGSVPVTPIFIVGMPRSGTSLVEQILDAHTRVHGGGELQDLPDLLFRSFALTTENFKTEWEALSEEQRHTMADIYLKRLAKKSNGEPFMTDKMPLNFLYCGLILTLFPTAKIIHCKREPRATCFSNFKTYFPVNVPFANDQQELAAYYRLYENMMAHWQGVMPGVIHDVQYENLVSAPEEHINALLEYCGLEWQEGCLEFHKTNRPVITASALQVKKPVYKDAVEYWRNFEMFMDPAILNLSER